MLHRTITYLFYLLFFLTPFFWTSYNFELFEYNKMILTYGITTLIVGAWLLKMVGEKAFIFKRTPLDIPLLLFLVANTLSTIFSIDPHTSFWGYYSRSNGGLLSLISYLLLYWAFVSNMNFEKVKNILKLGILAGSLISLWAIFEHFGVSLSCVILRGELNADCWIQDVQARVFATLGQPNWLAAYLSMLIFPVIYFILTSTNLREKITYYLSALTMYLAFTFTYSRGPTLGLIGGVVVFFLFYSGFINKVIAKSAKVKNDPKPLLVILLSFIFINVLFGSALTSFRLVSKFAAPARPAISLPAAPSIGTQLENGGTESGQIRFIVWAGAMEVFKNYPIFGSGLETFAYSYYHYRPVAHNLTSEWDFLYNKAHNEYLNYLSTTGVVGFGAYLLVIGSFIVFCIKYYVSSIKKKIHNTNYILLTTALLASYVSYLVYNFFLFSVVIIAIFFYLFPALIFVATESAKPLKKLPKLLFLNSSLSNLIYRSDIHTKIAQILIIILTTYFIFTIGKLWYADTVFSKGNQSSDSGNPGVAYNFLTEAVELNPSEPLFRSELAYAAAASSSLLNDLDATLSAQLKDESLIQMQKTLNQSPKNVSLWRTAVRTYFELATVDKTYLDKTLEALDKSITLAPTDPKLYYNKALILQSQNKKDEAIKHLQKAVELKPNYLEALAQLKEATSEAKKK